MENLHIALKQKNYSLNWVAKSQLLILVDITLYLCGTFFNAFIKFIIRELNYFIFILDPANDCLPYTASIDVNEYVTVSDAMQYMKLGPNGAMLFCMEFIEKHVEDIIEKINQKSDHYFLIDCPGQVRI